jgi:hypothetical protein
VQRISKAGLLNLRNKSFARGGAAGRFSEMTDQGRSLPAGRRQHAGHEKPAKQGDKGD